MKSSIELRQKRAGLVEQMRDIHIQAKKDGRSALSEEELATWHKINDDVKLLKGQYEAIEQQDSLEKEALKGIHKHDNPERVDAELKYLDVMTKYLKRGAASLNQDERKLLRATNVGSTDNVGGYLVTDEWSNFIVKTLLHYAGIYDVITKIPVGTGGTFNFPSQDDTTKKATIVSEGSASSENAQAFGEVVILDYTYTSMIKISEQLLTDSHYDAVSNILENIGVRHGRALSTDLTTGSGSSKPFGVVTGAADSTITAASTTAVTRAEIVNFIHKVDVAYRNSPMTRLMMHDSTVAAIKLLTVGSSDARPLWQPGIAFGAPDTIEGYRYVVNNDMAEMASSAKFMLFGDFSQFAIKEVGGFQIKRMNERYGEELAVGFLGWKRWGSKILNSGAIKYLDNAVT